MKNSVPMVLLPSAVKLRQDFSCPPRICCSACSTGPRRSAPRLPQYCGGPCRDRASRHTWHRGWNGEEGLHDEGIVGAIVRARRRPGLFGGRRWDVQRRCRWIDVQRRVEAHIAEGVQIFDVLIDIDMHGGVARLHMPHDDAPGMLAALRVSNPGGSNADRQAIATGADEGENCTRSCASWAFRRSGSSRVSQSRCTRPVQPQLLRPWYRLRPCGEGTARRKGYALGFGFLVGVLALGLEGAPELVQEGRYVPSWIRVRTSQRESLTDGRIVTPLEEETVWASRAGW